MKCPKCQSPTAVKDGRDNGKKFYMRRRRLCQGSLCQYSFTTYELPQEMLLSNMNSIKSVVDSMIKIISRKKK